MSVEELPMEDNKRTEPRLPHHELVYVEIMQAGKPGDDGILPSITATETIDISSNGLQVRVQEPFHLGSILQICVARESTGERYFLTAEVCWQRKLPGERGYMTGFALFESEETSIAEWKYAVADMLGDADEDHVHL